ncbi:MAG: VCBS repeat-containing protein [Anaerolineae bacterium]
MKSHLLLYSLALFLLLTIPLGCRSASQEAEEVGPGHRFKPASDAVISSPIAFDFDGDGELEIAVGSWDGYFYLLDKRLNDLPGWPKHSPKGFFSSPSLADLDEDSVPEIVVGSEAGKLFAWNAAGDDARGFPVDLGYRLWASPAVSTEPGTPDAGGQAIAIGSLEQMHLLDARGQPLDGWPQPIYGWPDATAAFAPLAEGQGILTVTTLTPGDPSRGWLYAWRENGSLLPGFPVELPMDSDSSPAVADFDGDGRWWIVAGDDAGWLHVVDTGGQERPNFPVRTAGPGAGPTPTPHPPGGNIYSIEASPAVADLDGDGRLEIAAGSWDGRMYLWDDGGQLLQGWPIAVNDQIISSAALVDLDGDERLDIVVGSKDGHLYGWTVEGTTLPGFPYDLGAPVFSSPWVGDLEGDGQADIVVGANNGIHLLEDVGPLGRQAWPTFHRDAQRTGVAP